MNPSSYNSRTPAAEAVRVLMVVGDFSPTMCGVGDYADMLSRSLVRNGCQVVVATKQVSGAGEREDREGIVVRRISRGWRFLDIPRLLKLIDELGPSTIVHIQYSSRSAYNRRFMINMLPAVLRLARRNNPVVVTMHGFHEQTFRYRMRAVPMLLASNTRVFVQAQDQRMIGRWLNRRIFPNELIPIGSNIPTVKIAAGERAEFRASLGVNSDLPGLVIFFGDLRPEKGFPLLLRSLRNVRESGTDLRLALLTDIDHFRGLYPTYAAKLDHIIDETGANQWMTVLNKLDGSSVARAMRAADLAVLPFALGACENRGSLLAALANDLPVLTTRGPSTPKDFELDYGVDSVAADDEGALSDRIKVLLRNPKEMQSLKNKAAGAQIPSWDGIATGTISLYRLALVTLTATAACGNRALDIKGPAE